MTSEEMNKLLERAPNVWIGVAEALRQGIDKASGDAQSMTLGQYYITPQLKENVIEWAQRWVERYTVEHSDLLEGAHSDNEEERADLSSLADTAALDELIVQVTVTAWEQQMRQELGLVNVGQSTVPWRVLLQLGLQVTPDNRRYIKDVV